MLDKNTLSLALLFSMKWVSLRDKSFPGLLKASKGIEVAKIRIMLMGKTMEAF